MARTETSTVRRATREDAGAVAEIIAQVRAEPNPVGFESEMRPPEVSRWIERQGQHAAMFVAEADGRVVGFAALDYDSARPDECTFGAWVRSDHRRHGHGRELADAALEFAREQGYRRIRGRLPAQNETALAYLSSIGALVPLQAAGAAFELPIYQEPRIRRATSGDARQLAEIIAEVVAEPDPVVFDRAMSPEEVHAWLERQGEEGATFVVDDGSRVLGFATIEADRSAPDQCSFGAWVRGSARRRGLGTALAEHALGFARQRGYRRIRGRLPERNEAALSYLSSVGALVPLTNPGTSFELPIYQEPS